MDNSSELSRTRSLAEAALGAMLRHGVPPTPRNFAVWYAHIAGAEPELSRTIETLVTKKQPFTTLVNEELSERFIAPDNSLATLQQTGDRMQLAVSQVLGHVEAARGSARDYGQKLGDYSAQLAQGKNLDKLPSIVKGLLAESE